MAVRTRRSTRQAATAASQAPESAQESTAAPSITTEQHEQAAASSESEQDSDAESSSASSSSSDSESDSDSDSDSSSEDSGSDAESGEEFDLNALAAQASESLAKHKQDRIAASRRAFETDDMIGLDDDPSTAKETSNALNTIHPPSAPKEDHELFQTLAAQYEATHPGLGQILARQSLASYGSDRTHLDVAMPKKTAKKMREAQRATNAGKNWFGLPAVLPPGQGPPVSRSLAAPSGTELARSGDRSILTKGGASAKAGDARYATADEIRREMVAIRLRNAMDPKRFFRGHQKKLDIPPYAQIGTVIASPFAPKQQLGRDQRGRTVVEEVMKDTQATDYAQRKAGQMEKSRQPGGRTKYRIKSKGNQKKKSSGHR